MLLAFLTRWIKLGTVWFMWWSIHESREWADWDPGRILVELRVMTYWEYTRRALKLRSDSFVPKGCHSAWWALKQGASRRWLSQLIENATVIHLHRLSETAWEWCLRVFEGLIGRLSSCCSRCLHVLAYSIWPLLGLSVWCHARRITPRACRRHTKTNATHTFCISNKNNK